MATTRAPSMSRRTLRSPADSPGRGSRWPVSHGRGAGGASIGGRGGAAAMTLVASHAPGSPAGDRSTTVVAPLGAGPDTLAAVVTGGAAATAATTAGRRADGPISVE